MEGVAIMRMRRLQPHLLVSAPKAKQLRLLFVATMVSRNVKELDYSQLGILSENIHRLLSEKECAIFDRGRIYNYIIMYYDRFLAAY